MSDRYIIKDRELILEDFHTYRYGASSLIEADILYNYRRNAILNVDNEEINLSEFLTRRDFMNYYESFVNRKYLDEFEQKMISRKYLDQKMKEFDTKFSTLVNLPNRMDSVENTKNDLESRFNILETFINDFKDNTVSNLITDTMLDNRLNDYYNEAKLNDYITNYYNTELDSKFNTINSQLDNKYDESEVDNLLADKLDLATYNNDKSTFATVSSLGNYCEKSYIDNTVRDINSNIDARLRSYTNTVDMNNKFAEYTNTNDLNTKFNDYLLKSTFDAFKLTVEGNYYNSTVMDTKLKDIIDNISTINGTGYITRTEVINIVDDAKGQLVLKTTYDNFVLDNGVNLGKKLNITDFNLFKNEYLTNKTTLDSKISTLEAKDIELANSINTKESDLYTYIDRKDSEMNTLNDGKFVLKTAYNLFKSDYDAHKLSSDNSINSINSTIQTLSTDKLDASVYNNEKGSYLTLPMLTEELKKISTYSKDEINDFNSDFDNRINTINASISSINSANTGRYSNVEVDGFLSTINGNINTLQGKVSTIEGKYLDKDIYDSGLRTINSRLDGKLDAGELETRIGTLTNGFLSTQSYNTDIVDRLNAFELKMNNARDGYINNLLDDYVPRTMFNSSLGDYVSKTIYDTFTEDVEATYVKKTDLSTELSSLSSTLTSSLNDDIDGKINSFKTGSLANMLSGYVTTTGLTNTLDTRLGSYVTLSQLNEVERKIVLESAIDEKIINKLTESGTTIKKEINDSVDAKILSSFNDFDTTISHRVNSLISTALTPYELKIENDLKLSNINSNIEKLSNKFINYYNKDEMDQKFDDIATGGNSGLANPDDFYNKDTMNSLLQNKVDRQEYETLDRLTVKKTEMTTELAKKLDVSTYNAETLEMTNRITALETFKDDSTGTLNLVGQLNTNLGVTQNNVSTLTGKVATLESAKLSIDSEIANIKNQIGNTSSQEITRLEGLITGLTTDKLDASAYNNDKGNYVLKTDYEEFKTDLESMYVTPEMLSFNLNGIVEAKSLVTESTLNSKISQALGDYVETTTLTQKIDDLKSELDINGVKNEILNSSSLTNYYTKQSADTMFALKTDLTSKENTLNSKIDTAKSELSNSISGLRTEVKGYADTKFIEKAGINYNSETYSFNFNGFKLNNTLNGSISLGDTFTIMKPKTNRPTIMMKVNEFTDGVYTEAKYQEKVTSLLGPIRGNNYSNKDIIFLLEDPNAKVRIGVNEVVTKDQLSTYATTTALEDLENDISLNYVNKNVYNSAISTLLPKSEFNVYKDGIENRLSDVETSSVLKTFMADNYVSKSTFRTYETNLGKIPTIENNIGSLTGRITTTESDIQTIRGDISSKGSEISLNAQEISTLKTRVGDINNSLSTYATKTYVDTTFKSAVLGEVSTTYATKLITDGLSSSISSINQTTSTQGSKISTLESKVSTLESKPSKDLPTLISDNNNVITINNGMVLDKDKMTLKPISVDHTPTNSEAMIYNKNGTIVISLGANTSEKLVISKDSESNDIELNGLPLGKMFLLAMAMETYQTDIMDISNIRNKANSNAGEITTIKNQMTKKYTTSITKSQINNTNGVTINHGLNTQDVIVQTHKVSASGTREVVLLDVVIVDNNNVKLIINTESDSIFNNEFRDNDTIKCIIIG